MASSSRLDSSRINIKINQIECNLLTGSQLYWTTRTKTKEQRRNFKSDVLQKHPDFEDHWVVSSKRMVQFQTSPHSDNGDVVLTIRAGGERGERSPWQALRVRIQAELTSKLTKLNVTC